MFGSRRCKSRRGFRRTSFEQHMGKEVAVNRHRDVTVIIPLREPFLRHASRTPR